jgi:hypothetical protein
LSMILWHYRTRGIVENSKNLRPSSAPNIL